MRRGGNARCDRHARLLQWGRRHERDDGRDDGRRGLHHGPRRTRDAPGRV